MWKICFSSIDELNFESRQSIAELQIRRFSLKKQVCLRESDATTHIICGELRDLVHLYNLKNVKNTRGGVLILVKLQAEACN